MAEVTQMGNTKIMKEQIIFYMHAGSGNHGCEAIVNSMCHMLKEKVLLISNDAEEDRNYSLGELCRIEQERKFDAHKLAHILYYFYRKVTGDRESFIRYRYKKAFREITIPLAISIGGDNYCYESMLQDLRLANNAFREAGKKTVLLGCSVEPVLLSKPEIVEDLSHYHLIIARESITFQALCRAGLSKVILSPDPAFTLKRQETSFPQGFQKGNTIGINLSPLIQESEGQEGITLESYRNLINHILQTTKYPIALIPHVVWERNDDRKPLLKLYEEYKATGRVILIEDRNCMQHKEVIANCRMFIGARTHATIAAYSTEVPTLVVGYSVKALGIAQDLFGTSEHYVLPVQMLQTPQDLVAEYDWLAEHEEEIRQHLGEIMPDYIKKAYDTGREVDKLWEELSSQPRI